MPINFACPRCTRKLSIATRKAGAEVTCPGCKQRIIVPTPTDEPLPGILIQSGQGQHEPLTELPELNDHTPIDELDEVDGSDRDIRDSRDDDDRLPIRRRKQRVSPVALFGVGFLALAVVVLVVVAIVRSDRAAKQNLKSSAKQTQKGGQPVGKARTDAGDTPNPRLEPVGGNEPDQEVGRTLFGYSLFGMICVMVILYWLFVFLLAVWVIRDARNRSVENGLFWMLLIVPFNVFALLIYLVSRPSGTLIKCSNCRNYRLRHVGICPHCHRQV
jgi:DNA-directed RNA polymerase subunit RPC12/RpoP